MGSLWLQVCKFQPCLKPGNLPARKLTMYFPLNGFLQIPASLNYHTWQKKPLLTVALVLETGLDLEEAAQKSGEILKIRAENLVPSEGLKEGLCRCRSCSCSLDTD